MMKFVLLVLGLTEAFHHPPNVFMSRQQQRRPETMFPIHAEKQIMDPESSRRSFFTKSAELAGTSLPLILLTNPLGSQASAYVRRRDGTDYVTKNVYFDLENENRVFYKQLRNGKSNGKVVENGAKVSIECVIRFKDDVNEVNYLSNKKKATFTIGNNSVLPKIIEAGLIGMNENGMREIISPTRVVFPNGYAGNRLIPNTNIAVERVRRLLQEDGTMCFEILITSIEFPQ
mmetsp:Transcript_10995/g.13236  ORF Transcript_10995/g.13236 Transcript_10995/m.13236 type:complete len:231 (-) Transcript_10995:48-740(-)